MCRIEQIWQTPKFLLILHGSQSRKFYGSRKFDGSYKFVESCISAKSCKFVESYKLFKLTNL